MPPASSDPADVRAIAVTAGDVVAALEAGHQTGRAAVLRVTPPFSGRMRARLHVSDVVPDEEAAADADPGGAGPAPLEIPPEDLVVTVPDYPSVDETEDALRADPDVEYTPGRHRERHEAAVAEWRARVRASIVDSVSVETPDGPHEVAVSVLGG